MKKKSLLCLAINSTWTTYFISIGINFLSKNWLVFCVSAICNKYLALTMFKIIWWTGLLWRSLSSVLSFIFNSIGYSHEKSFTFNLLLNIIYPPPPIQKWKFCHYTQLIFISFSHVTQKTLCKMLQNNTECPSNTVNVNEHQRIMKQKWQKVP